MYSSDRYVYFPFGAVPYPLLQIASLGLPFADEFGGPERVREGLSVRQRVAGKCKYGEKERERERCECVRGGERRMCAHSFRLDLLAGVNTCG